jgi:enoyl-CoA hydratase/carnithine racemase
MADERSKCFAHAKTQRLKEPTMIGGLSPPFAEANKRARTKENLMTALSAPANVAQINTSKKNEQIRVTRRSPNYWRVTIDNPPINVMGPEMVKQFQEVICALEADENVRVVVFDSAVDDYFLNHSDFTAKIEDLTGLPPGPTGLPQWPDFLVRLTRLPAASIALIRGRATGNGSEITLACDMSFASREKTIISQWEVGVGMVAGGGPMARLPQLIGRNRALEVLLSSEDIRADRAEAYGYINRALPDAELDAFVDALASRIAKFDKWAIAQTKRLVNTSLPPDVELGAGWDACIASLGRPAAQDGIKALIARGFHKPGDVESRLAYYLEQIPR